MLKDRVLNRGPGSKGRARTHPPGGIIQAMVDKLLGECDEKLVDEIVRRKIPMAKFPAHYQQVRQLPRKDLEPHPSLHPSTLVRLFGLVPGEDGQPGWPSRPGTT